MNIVFSTDRLILRTFTLDDAQLLIDLNSNPEVLKYLHEQPINKEKAQEVLQEIILPQYQLYNHGRWAVHLKSSGEFIGWCGVKFVKERNEIDLGYRFFQQHWGKGYATEAAKATVDHGFQVLRLKHIMAMAHVDNVGSQNVIRKCGMKYRGEGFVDNGPVKIYDLFNDSIEI